jgi:hypothetical protein
MGRRKNGAPLVAGGTASKNDFDYDTDPQGARCPFQSHVRRTNPRDGREALPRILRRGMSYGPRSTSPADYAKDRGMVFMAYCASIAEQFEVVQRWVAGGNSSGVSSSQADPFLAVPEPGEARTFRFAQEDGTVVRIDLGDRPFVSLQWGLYLFVPSLDALRQLQEFVVEPSPRSAGSKGEPPKRDTPDPLDEWRSLVEDPERSDSTWKGVRNDAGGVLATPYGLLVGDAAKVREVLQDNGEHFSVCGYGKRMQDSIGLGYLGLDVAGPHKGHDEQAETPAAVNEAIASITDAEAYTATRRAVENVLAAFGHLAAPDRDGAVKVPIDLLSFGERVLAQLCTEWFGLPNDSAKGDGARLMVTGGRSPEGKVMPRCPGNLLTISRYIFSSRPSDEVEKAAIPEGEAVLKAFKSLLERENDRKDKSSLLGTLGTKIWAQLNNLPRDNRDDHNDLIARTIAGVMMGFPPTVYGNFLRIATGWISTRELWDLQHQLDESRAGQQGEFDRARAVLFERLMETMSEKPIPETIWRTAVNGAKVNGTAPSEGAPDKMVILGLASAMKDGADRSLMFGGSRSDKENKTVHACPGYGMAVGVLLGMFSGLLEAGELRPTGSTVQLTLIPRSKTPLGATAPPR